VLFWLDVVGAVKHVAIRELNEACESALWSERRARLAGGAVVLEEDPDERHRGSGRSSQPILTTA
jgi:hypothetical protein